MVRRQAGGEGDASGATTRVYNCRDELALTSEFVGIMDPIAKRIALTILSMEWQQLSMVWLSRHFGMAS